MSVYKHDVRMCFNIQFTETTKNVKKKRKITQKRTKTKTTMMYY